MTETALWYLFVILAAVGTLTLVYHVLPFRAPGERKPAFAMFPKYETRYARPDAEVRAALARLKFAPATGDPNVFDRGKIYGDFDARAIALRVTLDPQAQTFRLGAKAFGVLFDTGDLWKVAHAINHSQPAVDEGAWADPA
ncbi:MAG: hypothetical protein AAFR04_13260 [Pseudomonadota bacterium]